MAALLRNPILPDVPLRFTVGDNFTATLTGTHAGAPVDLTVDWTAFHGQLRKVPGGPLVEDLTIDDTDADVGVLKVSIASADTLGIPAGSYLWDIVATGTGGKRQTIFAGHADVAAVITEVA